MDTDQRLDEIAGYDRQLTREPFVGCQAVVGACTRVATNNRGDINFTFQIPYEYRAEANKLFAAFGEILRLTVEPFTFQDR